MTWGDDLRAARQDVNLTREALARLSGVSTSTVRAYEDGSRNPSRRMLVSLLDALKVERATRNRIQVAAGFAPDGESLGPDNRPNYMFTLTEALKHMEQLPWPAFLFNDLIEVVAANQMAQRLWGIELEREFPKPIDRNMLAVSSRPRFADRVSNWEEMVRVGIAVFKGHHLGPEALEHLSPYFAEVVERFSKGDPARAARFAALWQQTEAIDPKVRWSYPVIWEEPGIGRITLLGLVTTANAADGLAFNDWIPCDDESWAHLRQTLSLRKG
jgi:transcriptional regulator with XRE-family HTH domain